MATTKQTTPKVTIKNNFVTKALAHLNKSDAQKQEEEVMKFVNRSIIATQTQIATIKTSKIPTLELELAELNNGLNDAKEAFETTRYQVTSSYESYIQARQNALNNITNWENRIAQKEAEIKEANTKLEFFEAVLADFN